MSWFDDGSSLGKGTRQTSLGKESHHVPVSLSTILYSCKLSPDRPPQGNTSGELGCGYTLEHDFRDSSNSKKPLLLETTVRCIYVLLVIGCPHRVEKHWPWKVLCELALIWSFCFMGNWLWLSNGSHLQSLWFLFVAAESTPGLQFSTL